MVKKLSNSRSQLMNLSREAGMADVAAGVLHNVGNVMTNVNVITSALGERVSRSKLSGLNKAAAMIREHQDDLGAFLTDDAKGKQLPAYLAQLAAQLEQEQSDLLQEIDTLGGNLQHVNQILDAQQQYATRTKALEPTSMEELLRNAIAMVQASLDNHQVSLDLSCEAIPTAMIDRSKLLQTIVNLLTNAKDAVKSKLEGERLIRLELTQLGSDQFRVSVVDNGQGIEAADLTRIFAEGFTTKPGGHGQGLHYCALAAKEMHGTLTVESDGVGYGAKFTLELPLVTVEERITV
jgi:signal transduction histidine kinase